MSVVLKQLLDVRLIITLPDACNKFGEERRPLRRASGETARYITNKTSDLTSGHCIHLDLPASPLVKVYYGRY